MDGAIGAVGYYSNLFVFDRYGLVTRSVALQDAPQVLRKPGHDKRVSLDFFLDQEPTLMGHALVAEDRLWKTFDGWEADPLARWYVARFTRHAGEAPDDGPRFLGLLQRLEEGRDPAAEWRRAREALEALVD